MFNDLAQLVNSYHFFDNYSQLKISYPPDCWWKIFHVLAKRQSHDLVGFRFEFTLFTIIDNIYMKYA